MRNIMYAEALNEAIKEEMTRDESVYYMGEDVRASIYGASKDLFDMYGEKRVWDTPCLLYTSPSPRDKRQSRMPSSA